MDMPVVLFSWPSKRNPFTYTEDECNAEWSAFHLEQILADMQREFGNNKIVLIGHSLGCRVICWALQRSQSNAHGAQSNDRYSHIFFCSPDIDEQIFKMNIPMLESASESTRVYASTRDIRLNFSKVLHGNPRLGLLKTKDVAQTEGNHGHVEIINYTKDDHSLFGHTIPFKLIAASLQHS
jgi:esterase/lipase superfamily enzyme